MPRCARVKGLECVYHIMVRSISDTLLFKDDNDKNRYLLLVKKYQETFFFRVYAYCMMDTHAHIIIDTCGADISKIMHGINLSYAQYFNRKYNRRGHLFMDRFKSKVVADDRNLIALSAYIHNNASDIKGYKGMEEKYKYSSFGIYLGSMEDRLSLVDIYFIMSQFSKDLILARNLYLQFTNKCNGRDTIEDIEFRYEKAEYRTERRILVREQKPHEVVRFVAKYIEQDMSCLNIKYSRRSSILKALSALLMRGICGMKQKDICAFMGNMTQANISRLCLKGIDLVSRKAEYRNIINDFIVTNSYTA